MKISTGTPEFVPITVTLETRAEAALLLSLIGVTSPSSRVENYQSDQVVWVQYPLVAHADLTAASEKYSVLYNSLLNSLKERQ